MTFSPEQKKLLSYLALSDFVQLYFDSVWFLHDGGSSITGPTFSENDVRPLIDNGVLEIARESNGHWISISGWRAMHQQDVEPYEGKREPWMQTACPDAESMLDAIGKQVGLGMPESRRFITKTVNECLLEICGWRDLWMKITTEINKTGIISKETISEARYFFEGTQELDFPYPIPRKEKWNV